MRDVLLSLLLDMDYILQQYIVQSINTTKSYFKEKPSWSLLIIKGSSNQKSLLDGWIIPSKAGRNSLMRLLMKSLNTFLTFSGVTSKYFQISFLLKWSPIIFSWLLQMSLRLIWSMYSSLFSQTFQKAMAAMVLLRMSNSPQVMMRSLISIMALSSAGLIFLFLQTRMIMCLAWVTGMKSILSLRKLLSSRTTSLQAAMPMLANLQMLNSSKQFSFSKQAENTEQQDTFLTEQQFLCLSFFSSFWLSSFMFCSILRILQALFSARSARLWLSLRTKQQLEMIFLARLQLASNELSLPMLVPPLSKHGWQMVVQRLAWLFSPQNCTTSFSKLMGWTSTQVQWSWEQRQTPLSRCRFPTLHWGQVLIMWLNVLQLAWNKQIHVIKDVYKNKQQYPHGPTWQCCHWRQNGRSSGGSEQQMHNQGHRYIGDSGCCDLKQKNMKNVRVLNLIYNYISDAGLKHLSQCQMDNLTHLYLCTPVYKKNGILSDPADAAQSPTRTGPNCNSSIWVQIVARRGLQDRNKRSGKLERGEVAAPQDDQPFNNIYSAGCMHLSETQWPSLTAINLNYNSITDDGCQHISQSDWPQLEVIHLGGNEITAEGVQSLRQTSWSKLKVLDIFVNGLGNEGCLQLKMGPWKKLMTLNLWKNNIGDRGCRYLKQAEWFEIVSINLCENKICDKGALWLSKTHWPKLQHAHLGSNLITNTGCKYIQKCGWTQLSSLDLGKNKITEEGLKHLLFGTYKDIERMQLYGNRIRKQHGLDVKLFFEKVAIQI